MRRSIIAFAIVAWLACGIAGAAEVVEFVDGRYLEVQSHTVRGDFIRLDVGPGSFLVCPAASVDEIRRGRSVVFRHVPASEAPLARSVPHGSSRDPLALPQSRVLLAPASLGS